MKKIIFLLFLALSLNSLAQSKHYESSKYNYSIDIPVTFIISPPRSTNNDLLFIENTASINMVVVKRDYITKSPHDLTKEFFYSIFSKNDPSVKIFDEQKIIVNGLKVYKFVRTMKLDGSNILLTYVCFVYYKGDMQYLLTSTCGNNEYDNYKAKFNAVGKSVKFN